MCRGPVHVEDVDSNTTNLPDRADGALVLAERGDVERGAGFEQISKAARRVVAAARDKADRRANGDAATGGVIDEAGVDAGHAMHHPMSAATPTAPSTDSTSRSVRQGDGARVRSSGGMSRIMRTTR